MCFLNFGCLSDESEMENSKSKQFKEFFGFYCSFVVESASEVEVAEEEKKRFNLAKKRHFGASRKKRFLGIFRYQKYEKQQMATKSITLFPVGFPTRTLRGINIGGKEKTGPIAIRDDRNSE
ncbi:hypothetical protein CHUAL_004030 [Chamberlinius hualienensis]